MKNSKFKTGDDKFNAVVEFIQTNRGKTFVIAEITKDIPKTIEYLKKYIDIKQGDEETAKDEMFPHLTFNNDYSKIKIQRLNV